MPLQAWLFIKRSSRHSFLSEAAPSIAFIKRRFKHNFVSHAARSKTFHLTLLEAFFLSILPLQVKLFISWVSQTGLFCFLG